MKPFLDEATNETGNIEFSLNALTKEHVEILTDLMVQKATEKHTIIQRCTSGTGSVEDAKILHQTQTEETLLTQLLVALTGTVYKRLEK